MSTKHFFESADGLVEKAERGAIALNPALRFYAPHKIIYDTTHSPDKVAILSGGGAGHEPGHAGVVGRGMLTAAVSGEVFASPSASQICSGVDLANSNVGVIFVVNRYTGDCLHFGLATEKTRAASAYGGKKNFSAEMVIVGDDVAVGRERGGLVGRRGLAGNIITCKVLGAAAEKGLGVQQLKTLGDSLVDSMVAIGTSLDHCHVPGRSKKAEEWGALPQDACEIGMGIHNEPGFKRLEKTPPASDLIREMLHLLLNQEDKDRAYVKFDKDDAPAVLLNNLGGVSQLEMNALLDEVLTQLAETYGLHPSRCYCNQYMTSLNAPGFGISLVHHKKVLKETGHDVLELLDAPTDAYSWSGVRTGWGSSTGEPRNRAAQEKEAVDRLAEIRAKGGSVGGLNDDAKSTKGGPSNGDPQLARKAIVSACETAIAAEPDMTRFDTIVGDGDAGETLEHASKAVIEALNKEQIDLTNAAGTCLGIGEVLESAMGGTSGAIYALFFAGLIEGLINGSTSSAGQPATLRDWGAAAKKALDNLGTYTPARPGDRTLVDALTPFCVRLSEGKPLAECVAAAKEGAEATKVMRARLGRATYVASLDDNKDMPPDPGAWGVWALVDGLNKVLG